MASRVAQAGEKSHSTHIRGIHFLEDPVNLSLQEDATVALPHFTPRRLRAAAMSVMLNRADVFRVHHSLHDGVQI